MTVPCISKETLQDETKLTTLLNTLFQEVETLSRESFDWPVQYQHGNVITRRKTKGKNEAHAYLQRSSTHDVTYDQLRTMLYLDHSLNETKYVKSLTEAVLLTPYVNHEANVFRLDFKTPPLSKNREFVELVATREQGRCFMVVSQPVEEPSAPQQGYVRGAYQAWEKVTEKQDEQGNVYVEWICIQRSSAGGSIPNFLSDHVAAKDFHHDVESLLKYIRDNNI